MALRRNTPEVPADTFDDDIAMPRHGRPHAHVLPIQEYEEYVPMPDPPQPAVPRFHRVWVADWTLFNYDGTTLIVEEAVLLAPNRYTKDGEPDYTFEGYDEVTGEPHIVARFAHGSIRGVIATNGRWKNPGVGNG